jgi:RND family efflux transporter MFP subunit
MPRISKSNKLLLGGFVLLAILAVLGTRLFLARRATASAEAAALAHPRPPTVATVLVARRSLEHTVTLTSELHPYDVVDLYAKVAGYLRDIGVDYGSRVATGQTLATLELPEEEADLEQAQAAYGLAKVDYERVASVARQEPGLIAQTDVDKARADFEMAKDQRDRAQVIMGYSVIAAPFAGVITKRYVDPGALIAQGTSSTPASPIVQLADTYRLRMVVETPESIVPNIYVGMPVQVKIQATGETIAERVARFSYDVHENTRTMHTEVDIDNPTLSLKPGMYASVTLDLEDRPNVVAVPTQALATEPSPNVWVVDRDDVIRERPVSIGLQTANWIEIRAGLRPGELIVLGDRSALTAGTRVAPKLVSPDG